MRKLILSIITVSLAFISLGVSTFAWFTLSRTATVTGLEVGVKSEDSLLIAHKNTEPAPSEYVTQYDQMAQTKLFPASTVNLVDWYKGQAAESNAYNPVTLEGHDTYETLDSSDTTEFSKYVFQDNDFWVKYVGDTDTRDLYISEIELTLPDEGSVDIFKSLRIGLKSGDNFFIYAKDTAATNNKGVSGANSTATISNWVLVNAANRTDVFVTLEKNTPLRFSLFVWFEGEDTNNFTNNLNLENCAITFKLSIEERD